MSKKTKTTDYLLPIVLLLLAVVFQSQFYRLKSKKEVDFSVREKLTMLGSTALSSSDVPVAALLMYHDSIIGEGYNTVYRDSNLSGHAEINAMNMAFAKYGKDFFHLDRDKLVLYSTFEPCEMCKGAMVHYGIKNMYFEKTKPVMFQAKSTLKQFFYEISKRRFDADSLQDKLFLQHPEYQAE